MVFMLVLSASMLFAENYVIVNSGNGIDVLSGVYYANVKGEPVKFMPLNAPVALLARKVGGSHDILLIQSKTLPANAFVQDELGKLNNVTVFETGDDPLAANLELADRSGTGSFILIDPSFGQNALSILPYAAKTKSYVLFAYSGNIDSIVSLLDRKAQKVTIFGYVDSVTKAKLAKYSPQQIGTGNDKYEDNLAATDLALKLTQDHKVIFLADGTFLEEGMVEGQYPIVFMSRIVPQETYDFLKQKTKDGEIQSAILVGTDLTTPAYDLKKRINSELQAEGSDKALGVVIKFGQSVGGGAPQQLDMFPLPYYATGLAIDSFQYNTATKKLELVVKSSADGPEYFQNQIRIKIDGVEVQALGDTSPQLLERLETKGTEYSYELPNVAEGNITADIVVRFGESSKSLSDYAYQSNPVATIAFTDNSLIDVTGASYDKANNALMISIKNNGTQEAYATVSADLRIGGSPIKVKSDGASKLDPNTITAISLPVVLNDQDLKDNSQVKVTAAYGAREGFLQKSKEAVLPLAVKEEGMKIDLLTVGLVLLVLVLLGLVVFFATRKKGGKK
jgi:hypothetical protein